MNIERFIRDRMPLRPVPGVPEIRLHLADPHSGLSRLPQSGSDGEGSPYFAHVWGGGLALARHVLDHPGMVAGRTVLDLGAGSGLVAIAAAMAGARQVLAADVDPRAMAAIRLNAAANAAAVEPVLADFTAAGPPAVALVLVGDLFYEAGLAARVVAFLDRCLDAGIEALVGDPWRASLPRQRLQLVCEYPVTDFGDRHVASTGEAGQGGAIFAFKRRAKPVDLG